MFAACDVGDFGQGGLVYILARGLFTRPSVTSQLTVPVQCEIVLHLFDGYSAVARSADEHREPLIVRPSFSEAVIPESKLIRVDTDVFERDRIRDDLSRQ